MHADEKPCTVKMQGAKKKKKSLVKTQANGWVSLQHVTGDPFCFLFKVDSWVFYLK